MNINPEFSHSNQFKIHSASTLQVYSYTLNSAYNEKKKFAEILLRYGWLFVKGDVFIGDWGIFGADIFLVIADFSLKATSL